MVLINPVNMVFVPFEVKPDGTKIKRDDLPRFTKDVDVIGFLKNNEHVQFRNGKQIRLDWIGHWEDWAIAEFYKGVGSISKGGSIIHHDTRQ